VPVEWAALAASGDYREVARALIAEMPQSDVRALRENPTSAVETLGGLTISYQGVLQSDCGGGGYYSREARTIYIHDAGVRRNNFTLLHEFGHVSQQAHPEWAFVLMDDIAPPLRRAAEEQVAHHFAAIILLAEAENASPDPRDTSPALVAAAMFEYSDASRSAALMNVKERMEAGSKWILAVADTAGEVILAVSTFDRLPPAKHSIQPEFADLAREAINGPVTRDLRDGIAYREGWLLDGLRVQAVLDHKGTHVFIALTPTHRFANGNLYRQTYTCENAGCATEEFTATTDSEWCTRTCKEPRCPECNGCNCPKQADGTICTNCFTLVTEYELVAGTHECP